MADVVPVADIGQPESPQRAEFFFQREIIRQRLARMKTVGESVDDRNLSVRRQLFENGLVIDARDDALHPALEIPRHVHDGLALAEPRPLRTVQENPRSHYPLNPDLACYAPAQPPPPANPCTQL